MTEIYKLPFPPSQNHYWGYKAINGRARMYLGAKGKAYRAWAKAAIWSADMTKPMLRGRLSVTLEFHARTNGRYDLDNMAKCLLDAVTHSALWEDDSQIDRLLLIRGEKCPEDPHVLVLIET